MEPQLLDAMIVNKKLTLHEYCHACSFRTIDIAETALEEQHRIYNKFLPGSASGILDIQNMALLFSII